MKSGSFNDMDNEPVTVHARVTPEEQARATRYVAAVAADVNDARTLLEMLGLVEPKPAPPRPKNGDNSLKRRAYSPEIRDLVLQLLSEGKTVRQTAELAKVGDRTVTRIRDRRRPGETP